MPTRQPVQILADLPGTGKTSHLLDHYANHLGQHAKSARFNKQLWITPTLRSRAQILNELAARIPVLISPGVLTFELFAEQILLTHNETVLPLSAGQKRAILGDILQAQTREKAWRHFGQVAQTAGFLDLIVSFISEVKRDEVWPEDFRRQCFEQGGLTPRDHDLCDIYDHYQSALHQLNRFDAEGRFWAARASLERTSSHSQIRSNSIPKQRSLFENEGEAQPQPQSPDYALIVVDGFSDFTRTQYEILGHLAELTEQLIITLPYHENDPRHDLFARPRTALTQLNKITQQSHRAIRVNTMDGKDASKPNKPAGLNSLAAALFSHPRRSTPQTDATGINFIVTEGLQHETATLAKHVKQMLLSGTPPEDIVVAFRRWDGDESRLREIWNDAGLPYAISCQQRYADLPVIRFVLGVLACERDRWRIDRLQSLLRSNYFSPNFLLNETTEHNELPQLTAEQIDHDLPTAISALLRELRRSKIFSGRKPILKRLKQLEKSDSGDDNSAVCLTPYRLMQSLSERLAPLRKRQSLRKWLEIMASLTRDLGVLEEKDADTWQTFLEIALNAANILNVLQAKSSAYSLAQFSAWFVDLAASQSVTTSTSERGRVRLLTVEETRSLDIPHLIIAGMNDGVFPAQRGEDCLYQDHERRALFDAGINLSNRQLQQQDELALFYMAATRATKSLTLSYVTTDIKGESRYPSPFVLDVQRLFAPNTIRIQRYGSFSSTLTEAPTWSQSDVRQSAVIHTRHSRPGLFQTLRNSPDTAAMTHNITRALSAAAARFATHGFTPFEGRLTDPTLRQQVARHYPPTYQFSASRLEEYANCPFAYFLKNRLELESSLPVELATDHLKRGSILHGALARLHAEQPANTDDPQQLSLAFRELIERQMHQSISTSKLQASLDRVELKLLAQWADRFPAQTADYHDKHTNWDSAPSPTEVEKSFGKLHDDDDEQHENEPATPPLQVGDADKTTFVRGRIDRLDTGTIAGERRFTVIDYKSGARKNFDAESISRGTHLQLSLYMIAILRLGLLGPEIKPHQIGYWSLKKEGFKPGLKGKNTAKGALTPLDETVVANIEETIEEVVPQLADNMRDGLFSVHSQQKDCTSRCDFHTICRVNQIRPLAAQLDKSYPNWPFTTKAP